MRKTGYSRLLVVTAVISVLLMAIIIFSEATRIKDPLTGVPGQVINPVQKAGYAFNRQVERTIDFYFNYDEKLAESEALKRKVAELEQKGRMFDEIQQENVELKSIFEYKNRHDEYDYIGTNVINRSLSGLSPSYTLDKGSSDGIRRGMVVITSEGLAGQITEVYPYHSVLETVSSENISVSVVSAGRKDFEGILSGTMILGRSNMAIVTELSLEAEINPGDDMVTSGIGGFYPPDIYVGKIETVSEDRGKLMKTAIVKPVVEFTGSERFYIVLPKNLEDLTY